MDDVTRKRQIRIVVDFIAYLVVKLFFGVSLFSFSFQFQVAEIEEGELYQKSKSTVLIALTLFCENIVYFQAHVMVSSARDKEQINMHDYLRVCFVYGLSAATFLCHSVCTIYSIRFREKLHGEFDCAPRLIAYPSSAQSGEFSQREISISFNLKL